MKGAANAVTERQRPSGRPVIIVVLCQRDEWAKREEEQKEKDNNESWS